MCATHDAGNLDSAQRPRTMVRPHVRHSQQQKKRLSSSIAECGKGRCTPTLCQEIRRAGTTLHKLSDGPAIPTQHRRRTVRLLACRAAGRGAAVALCAHSVLPSPVLVLRLQHQGHPALRPRGRLPERSGERDRRRRLAFARTALGGAYALGRRLTQYSHRRRHRQDCQRIA